MNEMLSDFLEAVSFSTDSSFPAPLFLRPSLKARFYMSRIPVPSHNNSSTSTSIPSSPSLAQLNSSNNMSSRPSARRPESVYSSTGSYLSAAAPPGTPPAAAQGDGLAETRKRQSRRDEVSSPFHSPLGLSQTYRYTL